MENEQKKLTEDQEAAVKAAQVVALFPLEDISKMERLVVSEIGRLGKSLERVTEKIDHTKEEVLSLEKQRNNIILDLQGLMIDGLDKIPGATARLLDRNEDYRGLLSRASLK
ncbi:hypothetical protein ACK8P5_25855 (plasmid) [Paenibacillus sp. EC2-1]|uniref:hypothetical protein n=1 Tax=Paenibacillus sp. EC2-1 TaxID=3388665 RepID=UPI003BEF3101